MEFRIADTFTESLTRLTSDEQKAVKTTEKETRGQSKTRDHSVPEPSGTETVFFVAERRSAPARPPLLIRKHQAAGEGDDRRGVGGFRVVERHGCRCDRDS